MSEGGDWVEAATGHGRVAVDPALGNIRHLTLIEGGRGIAPLHTAPWVDHPAILGDDAVPPVERRLSGDFFCAPFGGTYDPAVPIHGWPANSPWQITARGTGRVTLVLGRPVMGARITKTLRLADDAPLLYQEHLIEGGSGHLTVAHHPMVRLAGEGRFSCSPKRAVLTPERALDEGRNALALGARSGAIDHVPAAAGGSIDLTRLPIADRHEDFVTLVEAEDSPLGWSAVLREAEGDVVFVLKDPRVLPLTMLWHSNGGRDYRPWDGRHRGVLGIEDGCAAGAAGYLAALGPNPVADEGVPTSLALGAGRVHRIAHVIGAIARPAGWRRVADIRVAHDGLALTGDDGTVVGMPFDASHLSRSA